MSICCDDSLELCLTSSITKADDDEIGALAMAHLEVSPEAPELSGVLPENIIKDVSPSTPKLELKPLPSSLRYEFLGPNSTYPVIVNANLSAIEIEKLLCVIRAHQNAIGYSIGDLKGISPSMCMHRIYMEDDHKASIEHQRRLNPNMKEGVKVRRGP